MTSERLKSLPARNLLRDESTELLGLTIPRDTMVEILMRASTEAEVVDAENTRRYEVGHGLRPGTIAELQETMNLRILDVMITEDLDYRAAEKLLLQTPLADSMIKVKILSTQLSSGRLITFRLLSEDARIPEKLRKIFAEVVQWIESETDKVSVPEFYEELQEFEGEIAEALAILSHAQTSIKN